MANATVALCLAGQLRTLVLPWMLEQWRVAVVTPLRPDVFLRVSVESTWMHITARHGPHGRRPTASANVLRVLDFFHPIAAHVQTDAEISAAEDASGGHAAALGKARRR